MGKAIALVTGGSRGIGAATCRVLAADGYFVLVHYSKEADKAAALAKDVGGDVIQANFEHDDEILRMVDDIKQKYARLDVLVNNAGIAECEALSELTRKSFFKTIQVNLWAHALLTQQLVGVLNKGSIVFTSSVCAQLPTADALAYAASKAGIEAIVRSIAAQLAPNVRVNAVAPNCTETDMMREHYSAEDMAWVKETYPMKGPCLPEDIANMIAFLVSDKAKNITGQIFTVDAGAAVR